MDFVNPVMLGGAALAGIPILLHLIMRQKPQHLEFPALRFIRRRKEANRRRMRLRHLLLLLLRVLAICLVALAFARPSIKSSGGIANQEMPVAAALVFETSPRMQYQHQNRSRLEQAQEIAEGLLPQLPADSEVAVFESTPGAAVFQVDIAAAKQRVERLDISWTGRPLESSILDALALLEQSDLQRKEIYIFTDLSRREWNVDNAAELTRMLESMDDVGIYLVDVSIDRPQNYALSELRLSSETLPKRGTLRIESSVNRSGDAGGRNVELFVGPLGSEPVKRGQAEIEVTADGSQPVGFPLGGLDEGVHQGYVRMVGQDGLAFDDVRYFTVDVRQPWRVLVAAGAPAEQSALLLTQALSPEGLRSVGQSRFLCDVVNWDQLASAPLENYSAVCLLDPPPLQNSIWGQLEAYASGGGGVAVILGAAAQPIDRFNSPAALSILPAPLLRQARWPEGDMYLAPNNYQHPMLAKLRPMQDSVPWEAYPIYRSWQLGDLQDGASEVIATNKGGGALFERPIGRGRAVTLVTSLVYEPGTTNWNELLGFEAWPFFVVTNEMMLYLVGSTDSKLNYLLGQAATIRTSGDEPISTFVLTTPDNERFRRTTDSQDRTIGVTATEWPGQYRIQSGGSRDGLDQGFSVNVPLEMSDLERINEEELKQIFGEREFLTARNEQELVRVQGRGRVGRELFGLLMVIAALILGGEHFLANRFYRSSPGNSSKQEGA